MSRGAAPCHKTCAHDSPLFLTYSSCLGRIPGYSHFVQVFSDANIEPHYHVLQHLVLIATKQSWRKAGYLFSILSGDHLVRD
jgi:hypothetical protein